MQTQLLAFACESFISYSFVSYSFVSYSFVLLYYLIYGQNTNGTLPQPHLRKK
jgi:hypothetical protein